MERITCIFLGAVIVLLGSCKKEQETADALKGVWEISEVRLTDTTFVDLPDLPYTIEFAPCDEAYTATCRAYLNYPLNDTSEVYAKTDSLKFDIRDKEITFTDAQNESKFGFLLHRFTFGEPTTSPLTLKKTGNLKENEFPITIQLIKK
ncbi:MAG: hypothetical protein ACK5B6_09965 [Bacteroidia bacterium]|jgi:hypothetical protein